LTPNLLPSLRFHAISVVVLHNTITATESQRDAITPNRRAQQVAALECLQDGAGQGYHYH